jgi:ADP-dependent NAD(P)H-hydrate dehydratase / NAD(P)H-hydrate epimerase
MALPVITVEEMRAWEEASWRAGKNESEVIETVGRIVAERALKMTKDGDRILVLAGKGNNGSDARAAVAHLPKRKVQLIEVEDPAAAFEEVAELLDTRPELVIDGLFGIGLNRALSAEWVRLIERINAAQLEVFAIDVPSGLNAATGKPEGAAIRAEVTLTVGGVKRGLLAQSAWDYVGRLEVAPEIGLVTCTVDASKAELLWSLESDFAEFQRRRRPASSHKGAFGHVAIIAGSLGYHGAAVLAARGAQGAHPGLVTVITQTESCVPVASQLQSAMVHPWPAQVKLEEFCTTLVVGPGLAARSLPEPFRSEVKRLWRQFRQPMVVDASALDWLEPGAVGSEFVRVVTPHPGEAGRMLGVSANEVQADRVAALRRISEKFGGCWVVLKGHQSLVGRAKGPVFVNSTGNPFLAQGGSGDVLAGFLGGLLAQPELQKNVELTVRFAVWAHGAAADRLSARQGRWTVEELAGEVSVVGPKA